MIASVLEGLIGNTIKDYLENQFRLYLFVMYGLEIAFVGLVTVFSMFEGGYWLLSPLISGGYIYICYSKIRDRLNMEKGEELGREMYPTMYELQEGRCFLCGEPILAEEQENNKGLTGTFINLKDPFDGSAPIRVLAVRKKCAQEYIEYIINLYSFDKTRQSELYARACKLHSRLPN